MSKNMAGFDTNCGLGVIFKENNLVQWKPRELEKSI